MYSQAKNTGTSLVLLETFETSLDARQLQILFALAIGMIFGAAAQISRFCIRRAIAGETTERGPAAAVWITALASAVMGYFIANSLGVVDLHGHRYLTSDIPVVAITLGGLAFGIGMVLTRGCVSRLTVLSATGNLRAFTVLVIFAIAAHATLKGVLAPLRITLGETTLSLPIGSLSETPALGIVVTALIVVSAIWAIRTYRPHPIHVTLGVLIGLIPVLGWAATSVLLLDEFDPLPVQSVAFTLPWSDTLFWTIASSAIPATFGVGFIGGVLAGSFLSAAMRQELSWVSFANPRQTARYGLGAVLMGIGGVLAGGCTIGAGLSGVSAMSISAILALGAIIAGGLIGRMAVERRPVPIAAE